MNSGSIYWNFFFHKSLYTGKIAVYNSFFIYETDFCTESYTYYMKVRGREQCRDVTASFQ